MKFSYSLIKKFTPRLPAKKDFAEVLNLRSFEVESVAGDVLDVKLPANRYSDASSHIGIAREAAAACNIKFENPLVEIVNAPERQGLIHVEIASPKLCARYAGRYFETKHIGATPAWIAKALSACGLQPIHPVVDIMNYVMLEVGQPLHAFDGDFLDGAKKKTVVVRTAKRGESIETLDGRRVPLDESILVIADKKRPLAVAGIKGGGYAGVTKRTQRIFVEAANFNSAHIYRTSRAIGITTDASQRFSHDLSPALVAFGMDRATVLLEKLGAKLVDSVDVYPSPQKDEIIGFSAAQYRKLIGSDISMEKAKQLFQKLGFSIEISRRAGDDFLVRVPAWRRDIMNFEDIAEEAARLSGYDKLSPKAPTISIVPAEEDPVFLFRDKARKILAQLHCDEVYTHSFVSESEAKGRAPFGWDAIPLENPTSKEHAYLRPHLRAGVVRCLTSNGRYYERMQIFEIGKVFGEKAGGTAEKLVLGIGIAAKKDHRLMLDLKGIVDELFSGIGLLDYVMAEAHGMLRIEIGNKVLGVLEPVYGIGKQFFGAYAEIDLERAERLIEGDVKFRPLPKYPSVSRDMSLFVSSEMRVGVLVQALQGMKLQNLCASDVVDDYRDEKMFPGKRSITLRFIFQSDERTLTDAEADRETAKAAAFLKKVFKAEMR